MVGPHWRRHIVIRLLVALLAVAMAWQIPSTTLAQPVAAGLDGVVAVVTGGSHALVLRADGTVWGWGTNSDWELGVTTPSGPAGSDTPVQATGLDQVRGLATGSDHGVALRADGSVWAWGKNDHGQVGVPQGENCPYHPRPCVQTPVAVPGLSGVKAVTAAQDSSFALGADGTVWAWGDNGQGQLGIGSGGDAQAPTRVEGVSDIVHLSAADPHVVALRADGTVWEWGGTAEDATPRQVSGFEDVVIVAAGPMQELALKADGTVWIWGGRDNAAPASVAGLGPATALASGTYLNDAVAADGSVWSWWINGGKAPKPPVPVEGLQDIVAITIGPESNLALRADGTVWSWAQIGEPTQVPAPLAATPTP